MDGTTLYGSRTLSSPSLSLSLLYPSSLSLTTNLLRVHFHLWLPHRGRCVRRVRGHAQSVHLCLVVHPPTVRAHDDAGRLSSVTRVPVRAVRGA
eukprot:3472166-Prymnesium_polylepis.1